MSTKKTKKRPAARRKNRRRKKPGWQQYFDQLSLVQKSIITITGVMLLSAAFAFVLLKATENGTFYVYDPLTAAEPLAEYHHFAFADHKLDSLSEQAYIKDENDKIIAVNQGLVLLNTKPETENTLYTVADSDQTGYTNGSYGDDALYLDARPGQVLAQISGVKGWFDLADVQIIPYHENLALSYYTNINGSLVHAVTTDVGSQLQYSYYIGQAPDFLAENQTAFSYDGIWFYDDFYKMRTDVLNNDHENAINKEPFYNPWQYLPHHSFTQLDVQQANQILINNGLGSPEYSVLYDLYPVFEQIGQKYGVNPAMMYALALNESGFGTSDYAVYQNNLFGHAAYDENPDSAAMYASLADCIEQHAKYFINAGYGNTADERYAGSWFGNKASGMNVNYASDPYWGEKAASYFYQLQPDLDAAKILTFTAEKAADLYSQADPTMEIYEVKPGTIFSGLIQNEEKSKGQVWYSVLSDIENPLNNSYSSYIKKDN